MSIFAYKILSLSLAIAPGIVWLLYFLRKDVLPESRLNVLKVFLFGMIASIPAVFFEKIMLEDLSFIVLPLTLFLLVKYIFIISLVEEAVKFLAVRFSVLRSSHIDEPIDIPLYMIIAALGFATVENILVFNFFNSSLPPTGDPLAIFILAFIRFVGATLLHALCSGFIGVFIAAAFYYVRQRWISLFLGFSIAIILHGLFDFYLELYIMNSEASIPGAGYYLLYPVSIVVLLGILEIIVYSGLLE